MAKNNNTKPKSIEETLWQSCDKLRGSIEPSEYKHVVLSLIFLKFSTMLINYYKKLNNNKEKSPKVCGFFSDKGLEGKITVTKGGGKKRPTACPSKRSINRI